MSNFPNPFGTPMSRPGQLNYESRTDSVTVAGFFNTVYAWMASGLAITAVVAWWIATQPQLMQQLFSGPTLIILVIAQLVLVGVISAAVNKINATVATALFMLYAALNGLLFAAIFIVYTKPSIASTFVVCAGMFGAMSVWGYVTKKDLTKLGSLLFMALIGLILASVVNIFLKSPGMNWIISYAGVVIFVGLTAYDTQKLKMIAIETADNPALSSRLAISGALTLYLDFINLFMMLLRIMGSRRN